MPRNILFPYTPLSLREKKAGHEDINQFQLLGLTYLHMRFSLEVLQSNGNYLTEKLICTFENVGAGIDL